MIPTGCARPAPASSGALQRLIERIHHGVAAGILQHEWLADAETVLAEVEGLWQSERAFRFRTGASDKWCRIRFESYRQAGLARLNHRGKREWHVHARLPRRGVRDNQRLEREIVDSFKARGPA